MILPVRATIRVTVAIIILYQILLILSMNTSVDIVTATVKKQTVNTILVATARLVVLEYDQ